MKTLTNRQQELIERQLRCINEIENNHGEILNWFMQVDYPETLILQTCCFDGNDVQTVMNLGFLVTMYCEYNINNVNTPIIEIHIFPRN